MRLIFLIKASGFSQRRYKFIAELMWILVGTLCKMHIFVYYSTMDIILVSSRGYHVVVESQDNFFFKRLVLDVEKLIQGMYNESRVA